MNPGEPLGRSSIVQPRLPDARYSVAVHAVRIEDGVFQQSVQIAESRAVGFRRFAG